ncbi:MAG: UDP-glucose--hexose-1-phosphate uridylyltransferase [Sarcina sp.]
MNIFFEIDRLVAYGISKKLIDVEDEVYGRNRILNLLNLDNYKRVEGNLDIQSIEEILDNLTTFAVKEKLIEDSLINREIFSIELMAAITPRPSEVIKEFKKRYEISPKEATDYFYDFSKATNYVKTERVKKDLKWRVDTEIGNLDITINMSKPEKDPKDITLASKLKVSSEYPKCLLCRECEGYRGNISYPARGNHRIIPIELNKNKWFLQYSPYVYFNEHSIVLKEEHLPMELNKNTFIELLDFIEMFPGYFIGSNTDLPIVGGSILSHEHYQSGKYEFALERAEQLEQFKISGFEDLKISSLKWPLTVIRVSGKEKDKLVDFADLLLTSWKNYSDEQFDILAYSKEIPHNAITPICRFKNGLYEMDLVLRNNRTTEQYPYGIFHPHEELHHIKKENIGLIEVMGLAILPARLNDEIKYMKEYLLTENLEIKEKIKNHGKWLDEILLKRKIYKDNVDEVIKEEIGLVFLEVLKHCAVFKLENENGKAGLKRFMEVLDSKMKK